MNFLEHTIIGNKIIIEEYKGGYGKHIEFKYGEQTMSANVEETKSGIVIPTKMEDNPNFFLGQIKILGNGVKDKRFTKDLIVLIPKKSCFPIDDCGKIYYYVDPLAIVLYWTLGDHENFKLTNKWVLVEEFEEHDYIARGFTIINSKNRLRSLVGIVSKMGPDVVSEIDLGDEVLYEKNSPKELHINQKKYKVVNFNSIISYWK